MMRMLPLVYIFIFFSTACSSKSSTKKNDTSTNSILPEGFGTLAINGISDLPKVTDPVYAAPSPDTNTTAFDSSTGSLSIDFSLASAKNGIPFKDIATTDFTGKTNFSPAACEMVNRARGFLHMAAQADSLECEMAILLGNSSNIYDSAFHILEIHEAEGSDAVVERWKFKIEGDKEKVTGLTIYICENGEQSFYAKKVIAADNTFSIQAKSAANPKNTVVNLVQSEVNVSGEVNDEGKYVGLKKIDQFYNNQFSNGGSNYVKEQVVQSAHNLQYVGIMAQDDLYDTFIGYMELLNHNTGDEYSLKNLALGDGAMIYSRRGDAHIVEAWDGDTWLKDDAIAQKEKVEQLGDLLPTEIVSKDLTFSDLDAWDCSGDAEYILDDTAIAQLNESMATQFDRCDQNYELDQNSHLECF